MNYKLVNNVQVELTKEENDDFIQRSKDNDALMEAQALLEYQIKREGEYPSIKDLSVALWEHVIEGNQAASSEIQLKREAIKLKYPKP